MDDLKDLTPEEVAKIIFSKEPHHPCSNQIISYQDNPSDLGVIFEIILIIFMEGLMLLYDNLDNVDMKLFTSEHLVALNPWLLSLGFSLTVKECDYKNKEEYNDQYCRITIFNSEYKPFFLEREIKKPYCLFLNEKYKDNCTKNSLDDLYAIFYNGNIVYKISFKFVIV